MIVGDASQIERVTSQVDFVFCAVDMAKDATAKLEEDYARAETPVVSNNSAHRWTPDVPMMIPEINSDHAAVIEAQRKRLGTKRGFIAVKPNCSIQSYVPAIHPLLAFGRTKIAVCTYQAISGAGKTFETWPEMIDNVIPFIKGEEEKSEQEPLKIWGSIEDGKIVTATLAGDHRAVPPRAGERWPHGSGVRVVREEAVARADPLGVEGVRRQAAAAELPSAPKPFLHYFDDDDAPADPARSRCRARTGDLDRSACARRRDVRLALRRALAQHGARRCGRRGADRRAPHQPKAICLRSKLPRGDLRS